MKIFSIFIVFSVLFVNVLRCETLVNTNITETVFRVLESVKANQQAISPAEIDDNYNDGICVNQLVNFVLALSQAEWWAVQVIDAWGKLPSGILSGNFYEVGNFDQCLKIVQSADNVYSEFNSQYCLSSVLVDISVLGPLAASLKNLHFAEQHFDLNDLNKLNSSFKEQELSKSLPFMIGLCLPDTCSPQLINGIVKLVLGLIQPVDIVNFEINKKFCQRNEAPVYSPMDIFAIIIAALMVLSTIYDLWLTIHKKSKNPNLIAFSMYTNGEKLFKCSRSSSPNVMECVNGLRVLSITWVVISHTYTNFLSGSINLVDGIEWTERYHSVLIGAATIAVDTFFLLSGLLVAWSMLKELDSKKGKLNVPLMYLHRYLRITPALAAALLMFATLFRHMNDGPIWPLVDPLEVCTESWWTTLLYVQNYVNSGRWCIGPVWYLQIDMQLFILSPLIIYPLWRWRNKFIWIIPLLISLSMACIFTNFMVYHFRASLMQSTVDRMRLTYMPTHTRFGAWAIGVLLGYLMHNYRGKTLVLSKNVVLAGWTISLATILAIIFGFYEMNKFNGQSTDLQNAFYDSFSRVAWAVALAWIILTCHHGYGGPINWFLSLPQWQPLSRLSYSIYLLHTLVQMQQVGSTRVQFFFNDFNAIHRFWGDFGLTCCFAVIWTMAFESPILTLEKLLLGGRKPAKKLTESERNLTAAAIVTKQEQA